MYLPIYTTVRLIDETLKECKLIEKHKDKLVNSKNHCICMYIVYKH